jgi:hypothetical protein
MLSGHWAFYFIFLLAYINRFHYDIFICIHSPLPPPLHFKQCSGAHLAVGHPLHSIPGLLFPCLVTGWVSLGTDFPPP